MGWTAGPPQPRHAGLVEHQRSWLVVERLPAYAPELNPVEGLWSWLKGNQLPNLICPTLQEVVEHAELDIEHARRTPHLACSFSSPD